MRYFLDTEEKAARQAKLCKIGLTQEIICSKLRFFDPVCHRDVPFEEIEATVDELLNDALAVVDAVCIADMLKNKGDK